MAQKRITKKSQLRNYLLRDTKTAAIDGGHLMLDVMKDTVYNEMKNRSSGTYKRTGEMPNAFMLTKASKYGSGGLTGYSTSVVYDPDALSLIPRTKDSWGKHEGFHGEDFRDRLFVTLDQGYGSHYHTHAPYNFVDKAKEDMKDKIKEQKKKGSVLGGGTTMQKKVGHKFTHLEEKEGYSDKSYDYIGLTYRLKYIHK